MLCKCLLYVVTATSIGSHLFGKKKVWLPYPHDIYLTNGEKIKGCLMKRHFFYTLLWTVTYLIHLQQFLLETLIYSEKRKHEWKLICRNFFAVFNAAFRYFNRFLLLRSRLYHDSFPFLTIMIARMCISLNRYR